jgi:peptide deformylase
VESTARIRHVSSRALDDPALEERRQRALGHVRQLGDPVLRTPASPVEVFDEALRAESETMIELMRDARGVGLAAPQIGRLRRVIVIEATEDQPPTALVNPEITWRSEEEETATEGCLSIGEIVVPVPRATAIRVRAQDLDGAVLEIDAEDFAARVIQHEVDHLNGILILDRTGPEERKEALRELRAAAGG